MFIDLKIKIQLYGIIMILFLISVPQVNAIILSDLESSQKNYPDYLYNNENKGEWKTNYFCRINAWVYGWCEPELCFGIFPRKYAELWGYPLGRCTISGLYGTDVLDDAESIHIKAEYFWGFTHFWFQSMISEATMRGYALICEYRVE